MILHFLSGNLVAMVCVLLWSYFYKISANDELRIILAAIAGVLVVGFLWEGFELYIGGTSFSDGPIYFFDTASDLISDLSGGILGVLYAYNLALKIDIRNEQ